MPAQRNAKGLFLRYLSWLWSRCTHTRIGSPTLTLDVSAEICSYITSFPGSETERRMEGGKGEGRKEQTREGEKEVRKKELKN